MRPDHCKDCGTYILSGTGAECSRCWAALCGGCGLFDVGEETLSGDEVTDAERETCPVFCEEHAP